jgi:hypothetical protein
MLNHIPILGVWFALAVVTAALTFRSVQMVRLGWVGFIVCAVVAIPVFLTGEPSEEAVEHLPGVTHETIEKHEDMATVAFWCMEGLGALGLVFLTLSLRREELARRLATVTILAALATGGLMSYAGSLGGLIRHSELRTTAGEGSEDD